MVDGKSKLVSELMGLDREQLKTLIKMINATNPWTQEFSMSPRSLRTVYVTDHPGAQKCQSPLRPPFILSCKSV